MAKKEFFARAMHVINSSDIVLEVLDARFPDLSRNKKIEQMALSKEKTLLLVLNKTDLISKNEAMNSKKRLSKEFMTIFVSAKEKMGTRKLREAIGKLSNKKDTTVGIVGYPNTGKSSVINALKGSHSASVSSRAGHTHGEQFIRISEKVLLIDSPGVITDERGETFLAFIGAINPDKLEDVESTALELIDFLKKHKQGLLKKAYGIDETLDPETILENIAFSKKKVVKKGLPDTEAAARLIIGEWQKNSLAKKSKKE